MTEAVSKILSEIDLLSPPEREEVASAIMLDPGPPTEDVGDAFDATLARRVEEIRAGLVVGRSAEEVFARLAARRP